MVEENVEGEYVGEITHYFSNIGVAVLALQGELHVGDKIRIKGGEATDFEQEVGSMQVEHQNVDVAKKGDSVGLKVDQKVREGYKAYKVS